MKMNKMVLCSKYDGLSLSVLYTEPQGMCKGVVQISHGMAEHKERYLPFMEYLAECGYTTVIHDHRGHGESVRTQEELGYFYEGKDQAVVEDLHQITKWAKEKWPQKKFYLLGHSMGSLVARVYLKTYDYELDKLVLTGPPCKNPAVDLGLAIARLQKKIKGGLYKSKEIDALAFSGFAAKLHKEKHKTSWIAADKSVVEAYDASELCGFPFTTDGFEGLFLLMKHAYDKKGWQLQNPQLPILFLAGEEDPCAGNGRQFVKELQFLKQVGYKQVTGKRYPGMRHEILNEKEKMQVYANITAYLEKK